MSDEEQAEIKIKDIQYCMIDFRNKFNINVKIYKAPII